MDRLIDNCQLSIVNYLRFSLKKSDTMLEHSFSKTPDLTSVFGWSRGEPTIEYPLLESDAP